MSLVSPVCASSALCPATQVLIKRHLGSRQDPLTISFSSKAKLRMSSLHTLCSLSLPTDLSLHWFHLQPRAGAQVWRTHVHLRTVSPVVFWVPQQLTPSHNQEETSPLKPRVCSCLMPASIAWVDFKYWPFMVNFELGEPSRSLVVPDLMNKVDEDT